MSQSSAPAFATPRSQILHEVRESLSRTPRALPGKYLWDETGSDIFDRICATRDYYLPRSETALLERAAPEIGARVGARATLVEYGSGACRKIRMLLDALDAPQRYVAIDISGDYLDLALSRLRADYPTLPIVPVVADYTAPIALPPEVGGSPLLGFFPGSTIGNFDADGVLAFLQRARSTLREGWFLVSHDTNRDEASLRRAYGDAEGLMPALHLNMLAHLNEAIGADFDLTAFRHEIAIEDDPPRVEAALVATRAGSCRIGDETVSFAEGERIRTDTSYKMDCASFLGIAERAGWRAEHSWRDGERFALHLLRAF